MPVGFRLEEQGFRIRDLPVLNGQLEDSIGSEEVLRGLRATPAQLDHTHGPLISSSTT